MSKEKQIEEMWNIITTDCNEECVGCEFENDNWCFTHRVINNLYNAGYRKQSEDMVSIETVKKWLYEMAINNVGCILEGDFSTACELIISRLDGLKRFAEETKGGAE